MIDLLNILKTDNNKAVQARTGIYFNINIDSEPNELIKELIKNVKEPQEKSERDKDEALLRDMIENLIMRYGITDIYREK